MADSMLRGSGGRRAGPIARIDLAIRCGATWNSGSGRAPEHLVVSGFYCNVRNPMYVGVLSVITAQAVLFRSRAMAIEAVRAWFAIELSVRLYDEPKLQRTFGDEYTKYRRHVRRKLPRLTQWESPHV